MARQKGIIKLEGEIGDISFYKTQDGYMAREKVALDPERIKNDKAFARTRENMAEFSRAGKAAKYIRAALRVLLINVADNRIHSRLVKAMFAVIKADASNERGERNVIDGEAELLRGFDFNVNGKLQTTLFAPFTPAINRATGELSVSIPAFVPANSLIAPAGATHFKFTAAAAEINFQTGTHVAAVSATPEMVIGPQQQPALIISNSVTPASVHPLFLALGIEFFQQVNGALYPLKNGAFNALSLVEVSGGA